MLLPSKSHCCCYPQRYTFLFKSYTWGFCAYWLTFRVSCLLINISGLLIFFPTRLNRIDVGIRHSAANVEEKPVCKSVSSIATDTTFCDLWGNSLPTPTTIPHPIGRLGGATICKGKLMSDLSFHYSTWLHAMKPLKQSTSRLTIAKTYTADKAKLRERASETNRHTSAPVGIFSIVCLAVIHSDL